MSGLNHSRLRALALVLLANTTTTTHGLHAERTACSADGIDCMDGDTHKTHGAVEGGVNVAQESVVYEQCARLLVGGDAVAAASCFARVGAGDAAWCAEDESTALVVQATDVGSTKRVDRKMVRCSNPLSAMCMERNDSAYVCFSPARLLLLLLLTVSSLLLFLLLFFIEIIANETTTECDLNSFTHISIR